MLQVRSLTVHVGGRNVVRGANFTVAARDKVGLASRQNWTKIYRRRPPQCRHFLPRRV